MVLCSTCGATNSDNNEYCLGCLAALPVERAPSRVAGGSTGAANEAGDAGAEGMAASVAAPSSNAVNPLGTADANVAAAPSPFESLTVPDSMCPRHPDRPAAGTCTRCGTFLCALCVPSVLAKSLECPDCLASKEGREAPAVVKAIIQEQWMTLALLGLLVGGIGFAAVMASGSGSSLEAEMRKSRQALIIGAIPAVPFAIASLMVGLVRRMWAIWAGYVIEVIIFGFLALNSFASFSVTVLAAGSDWSLAQVFELGFTGIFLVIEVAVPLWSLTRLLKLSELVKKYPGVLAASRGA